MLFKFSPNIKAEIFLKDPESSQVGIAIIRESIVLINALGFEEFTFKKLALKISTTEATIYRYFENKHKLLLYITSWYWCWVEYQLMLKNTNIENPELRLYYALHVLSDPKSEHFSHIDLNALFEIICGESSKSYLIKNVDNLNKSGVFTNYKQMVIQLSDIILEINSSYPYPHMLITTIIEGIHHQLYFARHLPTLTDKGQDRDYLINFYHHLALTVLKSK